MGVLNVTPDSFSDGGQFLSVERAVHHGIQMFEQGAELIDVGGESTRPGATPIAPKEEQARVLPVIRELSRRGVPTSIDTLHASTARAAVEAGATMINDVSGALHDPNMLDTAAWAAQTHGVGIVLGHWRGIPDPRHQRSTYDNVVAEVRDALAARALAAEHAGVHREHIVLDPGLGFDKTAAQGWQLLAHLATLRSLGYPVLVGASRKRMIAEVLRSSGAPTHEDVRDGASAVASALVAVDGQAWGVRVHQVAKTVEALAVVAAWNRGRGAAALDHISLRGVEVFAHHGVYAHERQQGQKFFIDLDLSLSLAEAGGSDELSSTVHYGELASDIVRAVERDPVDLIETVAERVAALALARPNAREAVVTVHKPDAPMDADVRDASVTIVRRTEQYRRNDSRADAGDAT